MFGSMPNEAQLLTADGFRPEPEKTLRNRRLLYTASSVALTAIMALAVLDGSG